MLAKKNEVNIKWILTYKFSSFAVFINDTILIMLWMIQSSYKVNGKNDCPNKYNLIVFDI